MPAAPAWHIHPAVGCFGQAEARQAVPGLGTRCPGALRDSRLSPGCALGAPVWLRGARLCPGHRMPGVTAKGARGHSEGTQAVARSQGARGHSEGTQARSRPGPAVAGLSPAVPCPADGADDRQYAGPRHGHQDEEPALAHHRHPPRHDRWVPAMVSPARRVWELPGVPSPCSSTHWPPPRRSSPRTPGAQRCSWDQLCIGCAGRALARPWQAPVTLRDPWHCHAVPDAPAENPPISSLGDPTAPQ